MIEARESEYVIKRNGERKPFIVDKIVSAIRRAGAASGEFGDEEAHMLATLVVRMLAYRYHDQPPSIESIQDLVERTLVSAGHFPTARAYIVYREQHRKLREDKRTLVDVASSVNEYLERQDWRVNANANQGYSLGGLILNVSGKSLPITGSIMFIRPRSARPIAPRISMSTISICFRDTAPAGRCAASCTRGLTACRARSKPVRPDTCRAR